MRLLVTRPKEEAVSLAAELTALGHQVLLEPMLKILPRPGVQVVLGDAQALLFTSANGLRRFAALTRDRSLPAFTVGDATATAARAAGFAEVHSAQGTVEDLAALAARRLDAGAGSLYHAAGSKPAGDLQKLLDASGFRVTRQTLYHAVTSERLSEAACDAFRRAWLQAAIFFSPRTASCFVGLAIEADIVSYIRHCHAFCLSEAVAEKAAGLPWLSVHVAGNPNRETLLGLLASLDNGDPEAP